MPFALLGVAALLAQLPLQSIAVRFDRPVEVGLSSVPVKLGGNDLHIVGIGQATFHLESQRVTGVEANPHYNEVETGLYGVRWNRIPEVAPENKLPFTIQVQPGPFLSASVKLSVAQYNTMTYRIGCAVFAKDGRLLGTAHHDEKVDYIRLGQMPTVFRTVQLDFGSSRDFSEVAYAVFSISDPVVPPLPEATSDSKLQTPNSKRQTLNSKL